MNENKDVTTRNPLEIGPEDGASIEEWQEWAFKLRDRVQKLTIEERKRISQLRTIRKDIRRKDKALGYYKKVNEELIMMIKDYESGIFFELREFIKQYLHKKSNK